MTTIMDRKKIRTMEEKERIQRVVFIRHGVARHNLLDPITGQPPKLEDPKLWDPPLVHQGKQQVLEAGERFRQWWKAVFPGEPLELIVSSPLTRCLQTSTLGFLAGDMYTDGITEPKFFATELVREAFGMHYPDKRRDKSLLQKHWPHVTFSDQMKEADENWKPDQRETVSDVESRVHAFLCALPKNKESNIVVISHGIWVEVCFHRYCPEVLEFGKRRVHNCNVFVGELISKDEKFLRLQNVRRVH